MTEFDPDLSTGPNAAVESGQDLSVTSAHREPTGSGHDAAPICLRQHGVGMANVIRLSDQAALALLAQLAELYGLTVRGLDQQLERQSEVVELDTAKLAEIQTLLRRLQLPNSSVMRRADLERFTAQASELAEMLGSAEQLTLASDERDRDRPRR